MRRSNLFLAACLFVCASCSSGTSDRPGAGGKSAAGGKGGAAGGNKAQGGSGGGGGKGAAGSAAAGAGGRLLTNGGGTGPGGAAGSAAGGAGGTAAPVPPTLVTSSQGAYWQTDAPLIEGTPDSADVTVDSTLIAQPWQGFGGTFSERSADALALLSADDQLMAMNLLFGQGPGQGLRFTYGRIPIGASDYAIDRYSLDETPGDTALTAFSIERDKQKLIPYVKAALAVAPGLHLWASPWSPPTWMKSSNGFDGGNMKEDATTLQAYALYLAKFVQEYGKLGIRIEVIHPQKEPNLALDFPSCIWSAPGMARFIGTYLGPTFTEQKVDAAIFLGSLSEDDRGGRARDIIAAVTGDANAMGYVKGFGFEWDGLKLVDGLRAKKLPLWQDNHNVGNLPWNKDTFSATTAPNDHAYAMTSWSFLRDWIRGGVDAYFTSNMILDSRGVGIGANAWPQNALLVVDPTTKGLIVTPVFHLFRHLSAFVDPGASVVGVTGGDALAFKNPDGSVVAVLYNAGAAMKTTVALAGKKLQFTLPARGWATVKAR